MPSTDLPVPSSECSQGFGHPDFAIERVQEAYPLGCPVRDCSAHLPQIPYRGTTLPFCPVHGLRLHSETFVYWNGQGHLDQSRIRNFPICAELAAEIALKSKHKAESHRLGHETSEDALTWNVFAGLADARKLKQAVHFLTGRTVTGEPRLYLWGELIDPEHHRREHFEPLRQVRGRLEPNIHAFQTEPDIMLVVDGELLVCVEAKFASGNPIAHETVTKTEEKPADRRGLLDRYYGKASEATQKAMDTSQIGDRFHSQLFRNIVFASEMAHGADWHVANLVSSTQGAEGTESAECSFVNPEQDVCGYLTDGRKPCFTFRTWEDLHAAVVNGDPELEPLNTYMRSKSAHYRPAFLMG